MGEAASVKQAGVAWRRWKSENKGERKDARKLVYPLV